MKRKYDMNEKSFITLLKAFCVSFPFTPSFELPGVFMQVSGQQGGTPLPPCPLFGLSIKPFHRGLPVYGSRRLKETVEYKTFIIL